MMREMWTVEAQLMWVVERNKDQKERGFYSWNMLAKNLWSGWGWKASLIVWEINTTELRPPALHWDDRLGHRSWYSCGSRCPGSRIWQCKCHLCTTAFEGTSVRVMKYSRGLAQGDVWNHPRKAMRSHGEELWSWSLSCNGDPRKVELSWPQDFC